MSADDRKNTERAETKVTERMFLDIARAASLQDRSVSDYLRVLIRNHLYGHCRSGATESNDDMSRNLRDTA